MTGHRDGPTGPGTVVLNIGQGVGALILYTSPELAGQEIEISPGMEARDGIAGPKTHALVRERTGTAAWNPSPADEGNDATEYAAVYDALPAGQYAIWLDGRVVATVTIAVAAVTRHRI
jgi:hypothetical protein